MAEAPDAEWSALIALCGYGGLRCPSEHRELTWGDVDFAAGRVSVRAVKSEGEAGGGWRVVPMFPELRCTG